jgi:glycosyltransferase involved in cell wall biosynthesis
VGALTPSRNEGLSNTILEYMAAGLPVVATDCGGNKELVREGEGGFVVKSGDAEALAGGVIDLLRKPARRKAMGDFNRKRVAAEFQPGAVGVRFEAVYQEVLPRRSQRSQKRSNHE